MAVYVKDKNGKTISLKKGQTLAEKVKVIKEEKSIAGEEISPCVKELLNNN